MADELEDLIDTVIGESNELRDKLAAAVKHIRELDSFGSAEILMAQAQAEEAKRDAIVLEAGWAPLKERLATAEKTLEENGHKFQETVNRLLADNEGLRAKLAAAELHLR